MKIYFLSNYTQNFIVDNLIKNSTKNGLVLDTKIGGFNQFNHEIIDQNSNLYSFNPKVVFLSIDLGTLVDDIIYSPDSAQSINFFEDRSKVFEEMLMILSKNLSDSLIFVDNFFFFRPKLMLTTSYNTKFSYSAAEEIFNQNLFKISNNFKNISIVDLKSELLRYGYEKMCDERMYYISKSHWSQFGINQISNLYLNYINAYIGKKKKCIVLDLDNTLWGGVIGDDGIENIILSNDGEGRAFYDFQRELKILYERGVILAIASKNTEEVALEAINNHPYMILKMNHFISTRINWNNKADNIREIANEINIALDSIVFLDDSKFERELISKELPEVCTPELPEDSSYYSNFLRGLNLFDTLSVTNTDLKRNKMYKENIQRKKLQANITNIKDYYYSLKMEVKIEKANNFSIPRIAQMTQKTNQFNLRTIRYTEADIMHFVKNSDYEVFTLELKDNFGDNGIVGTAIVKMKNGEELFIDSFLFSCRALGRTAESALLYFIVEFARRNKFKKIIGEYIPTKKNLPCKDFYKDHRFKEDKYGKWVADLTSYTINKLPWLKIIK